MIKAIETVYNGFRFRSRLEARWAVFFDTLGVKYEYEKEGFELEDGLRYLPDFWLPSLNCWVEIKATAPSELEIAKAGLLAAQTRQWVNLIYGNPYAGEHLVMAFRHRYPPMKVIEYVEVALKEEDSETFEALTSSDEYYWQPWRDKAWDLEWYYPPSGKPYHTSLRVVSYHKRCQTLSFSHRWERSTECPECGVRANRGKWMQDAECFYCEEHEPDYVYDEEEKEHWEIIDGPVIQGAYAKARQARFEFNR